MAMYVSSSEVVAGLVGPNRDKWGGLTITYSVPSAGAVWDYYGDGEASNASYSTFSIAQAVGFRSALSTWDSYIASSINEVSDTQPGQIRIAFTDASSLQGQPSIAGYAYSPPSGAEQRIHGDIWIDESLKSATFASRTSSFHVLLHEIGHSLGLKHPFEAPKLPADYENTTYSVMSYDSQDYFYTWSGGSGSISYSVTNTIDYTPMVLDILAIQNLYGADLSTNAGNTIYTFSDLNGRQAIYDAGGIDTLDLSALTRGSYVDLRPGGYSDIARYAVAAQEDDLVAAYGEGFRSFIHQALNDSDRPAYEWTRNVGISFSTIIENVNGSSRADTVVGNSAANTLRGNAGADRLDGAEGNDTLYGGYDADQLIGGAGFDYARYDDANYGNLTVSLASPTLNTGAALGDTFVGIEGLVGGVGNDKLYGNTADNYIYGLGGNDNIWGSLGADFIDGGTGLDYVRFDDAGYAGLQADLAGANSNTGAAKGDVYTNIEGLILTNNNDSGFGNELANYLYGLSGQDLLDGRGNNDYLDGGVGNDRLFGGAGNDTLVGNTGADALTGGIGNDIFVFRAGYARDNITDFAGGTGLGDQIDLRGVFTSYGQVLAASKQVGANLEISLNPNDVLIIENFSRGNFAMDDLLI